MIMQTKRLTKTSQRVQHYRWDMTRIALREETFYQTHYNGTFISMSTCCVLMIYCVHSVQNVCMIVLFQRTDSYMIVQVFYVIPVFATGNRMFISYIKVNTNMMELLDKGIILTNNK